MSLSDNLAWTKRFIMNRFSPQSLGIKSWLQFETSRYQTGTFSSVTAKLVLIIHHAWQTSSGLLSSCNRFFSSALKFFFLSVRRLHTGSQRVYLLSFVSFCKQSLTGFDLTCRHKWWHYFNSHPRSQWLCSWAFTIIGVMCGWCPSGWAASLNGWKRVTGCRGDALLMRVPD